MNEPSVLDLIKSWLDPRQKEKIRIPSEASNQEDIQPVLSEDRAEDGSAEVLDHNEQLSFPKYISGAFLFFVAGQVIIEISGDAPWLSAVFFLFGVIGFILAWRAEELLHIPASSSKESENGELRLNVNFVVSLVLAALAFVAFGSLKFTMPNTILWVASIIFFFRGIFVCPIDGPKKARQTIKSIFSLPWKLTITKEMITVLVLILIILLFRFVDLSNIPGEPFSDHAEKLLDVQDVLNGEWKVYFPRNTGREFIQFFLTALIARFTDFGVSFMSLKIGTALIGLFPLPFIYLIGKEVGGKRVGVYAALLAGVSYWLNVISRIGLRFPLYPAFAAPAIYFLIKGLRRGDRNSLLLSGLFLGLGLHGYSPFRVIPIAIVVGIVFYFLAKIGRERFRKSVEALFLVATTSFLVFIPLLRYVIAEPMMFSYRALTRMTGVESAIDGSALLVFLKNNLSALLMLNVNNGQIWVHSIPNRPALDVISAGLFLLGLLILLTRIIKSRDWVDMYLLVLIPILLLPSTLSLAFPSENPSLNRTGAVAIVVFIIAAIGLEQLTVQLKKYSRALTMFVIGILLTFVLWQNYGLVFTKFKAQFLANAWNTSEIGADVRYFTGLGNDVSNARVIPYPHWVDTRLVGIQAGYPSEDLAMPLEALKNLATLPGEKLFIFKEDDLAAKYEISNTFPNAYFELRVSEIPNKNYWLARTR